MQPQRSLTFFATYTCISNVFLYILQLMSDTSPTSARIFLDFIGSQPGTSMLYNKIYLLVCDCVVFALELIMLTIAYEELCTPPEHNSLNGTPEELERAKRHRPPQDGALEPLIDVDDDGTQHIDAPPVLPSTTEPTAIVRLPILWGQRT